MTPLLLFSCLILPGGHAHTAAPLPAGVAAEWNVSSAYRVSTPTRERICINGLWQWKPAMDGTKVPESGWGWFKVPGCWPGITDYLQKDTQRVIPHPDWKDGRLDAIRSAWYQREIDIPLRWRGRRLSVYAQYVNSVAEVYVDNARVGAIRFPAGRLDLTTRCKPGKRYRLSIRVTALPLKSVMTSFTDTNNAVEVRGAVARRGLCGDVFLESDPPAERITDVRIEPSFRRRELVFDVGVENLRPDKPYLVRAEVLDHGTVAHRAVFPEVMARTIRGGSLRFSTHWMPKRLWDIHTPQNQFTARVSLISTSGAVLDEALPAKFGFREMWIQGRDFYLNGTRLFLSAVPLDNAQVGTAWSTYAGARESLLRLRSFGINFVYTHNYDCEPGSHLSFEEILRAADDVGLLVALSQPHFSSYEWQKPDADRTNGYTGHARFYVGVAQNHPSVIAYAMSHNATSYDEAKNPEKMDGRTEPRDSWALNNARKALRAEAIVRSLDPGRIVYHHSSGNLGAMYTENFYLNFAPIQEVSDWFGAWAARGVKPLFLCEYGVPFSWDWTLYRGWYKGKREWGSADVPWEICIAEWNAQFVGDRAYKISDREQADIRWEAAQFRSGRTGWHRWDYPTPIGSSAFDERNEVFADYITDNWRAFRTWGVSAFSPWEYEIYWQLRPGADRKRVELPVDWAHLQRPGYSPDYVDSRYETMSLAYGATDWVPSAAARALYRNNRPLLGYIGGKSSRFTSKDHNFKSGDTIEKQLIVVNNSRETVSCECTWTIGIGRPLSGRASAPIRTGEQARIPLKFSIPPGVAPGGYRLEAVFHYSTGESHRDSVIIDVVAPSPAANPRARLALFDPQGETSALLSSLGVQCAAVTAESDLSGFDVLIIGKKALTVNGLCPDVRRVRQGLKLIVFEQTADVLEKRMGFRVQEYGLRRVFPRIPGHPLLAGIRAENMHDWTGEATLSTARLEYKLKPMYGPMVEWCGMEVPHVWRCGCQGSVASVLIEKPARGDFLPIIDGGFSLQYTSLAEFREGNGLAIFCQLDVTGRTESDPAARHIVSNIVDYVANWKPKPKVEVLYAGAPDGLKHLQAAGFRANPYSGGLDARHAVLVLGPGTKAQADLDWAAVRQKTGDPVLLLGGDQWQLARAVSRDARTRTAEHISAYFEPPPWPGTFAGIGPADVHNRDPRQVPLVESGAEPLGDGLLADAGAVAICQLVPWEFDAARGKNQKRTWRRSSFLLTRLLCNLGAESTSALLDDFVRPVVTNERRWLHGLYLDTPEEWDDPYRFFGW